jgi:hypothetical protein
VDGALPGIIIPAGRDRTAKLRIFFFSSLAASTSCGVEFPIPMDPPGTQN